MYIACRFADLLVLHCAARSNKTIGATFISQPCRLFTHAHTYCRYARTHRPASANRIHLGHAIVVVIVSGVSRADIHLVMHSPRARRMQVNFRPGFSTLDHFLREEQLRRRASPGTRKCYDISNNRHCRSGLIKIAVQRFSSLLTSNCNVPRAIRLRVNFATLSPRASRKL